MTARRLLVPLVCFFVALPIGASLAAKAPSGVKSVKVRLTGKSATYSDDLGLFVIDLKSSQFASGQFEYKKKSANEGTIKFTSWNKQGGTYSGTFAFTFKSATGGTYREDYTGTYNGYVSGTFEIVSLDAPGNPKAKGAKVKVKSGGKKTFKLKAKTKDIRKGGPTFKITQKPRVGKLVTNKLPKVVYKAPKGFKGTVKFKFIVKEGSSKSKPATVKLKVE